MTSIPKLQNENNRINQQIKTQSELMNKYKIKLTEIEKEKAKLLTTIQNKEKKINEDNNIINKLKIELETIQSNFNYEKEDKNENFELEDEKEELKQKQKLNDEKINELQIKLLKLEDQLKIESERDQKDLSLLIPNYNNNNGDLFLTGNELNELKEKNERLQKNIEENNLEINNMKIENEKLKIECNNVQKEKEEYNFKMNVKNEELEKVLNENNILSNTLYESKMGNQKLIINLNNIKIKFKALKIDKNDLEEVILKQEGKVTELNNNVSKIITLLNKKNSEIDDNKMYITKLKETIDELNIEFNKLKAKKEKAKKDEIKLLRNELMSLKMEKERNNSLSKGNISVINENIYNFSKRNKMNGKLKLKKIRNSSAFHEKISYVPKGEIKEYRNYKPLSNNMIKQNNNDNEDNEDTEKLLDSSMNFIEKTYRNDMIYRKYHNKYNKVLSNVNNSNNISSMNNNDITNIVNKNINITSNINNNEISSYNNNNLNNNISNINENNNKSYVINDSPNNLQDNQEKEKISEFKSMIDDLIEQF